VRGRFHVIAEVHELVTVVPGDITQEGASLLTQIPE